MTIFIVCIILGGVVVGIWIYDYYCQKQVYSFWKLENLYSSLLSDMNIDFRDETIHPENIIHISKSISQFVYTLIYHTKHINTLHKEEKETLIALYQNFHSDLDIWIKRHMSEIEKLSESLEESAQKTQIIEWKSLILLSKTQLDSYIEDLGYTHSSEKRVRLQK